MQTSMMRAGEERPQFAPEAIQFSELGLAAPLLAALRAEGYEAPTPIQARAIPEALAGRDLLGSAQTGTGKTAAFALPILQRLIGAPRAGEARRPRALVLSPTRELAAQIGQSFANYGHGTGLRPVVVFGGVSLPPQASALNRTVDVLVATPGRLLDLMRQRAVLLDRVEAFVLDEADRMLDMGFLPDVRQILRHLPRDRQTLLFSATMPRDIERLAREMLVDPVRVEVAPVSSTAERIDQSVYMVEAPEKRRLLERLLREPAVERALVFTRTKHGANRLVRDLERSEIRSEAIHGNKSQSARQRALDNFKSGRTRVLIATDVAARGIDVDAISHVINYDVPNVPESYVHRIGRTARAGAEGIAISLCSPSELGFLRDIERTTRTPIRRVENTLPTRPREDDTDRPRAQDTDRPRAYDARPREDDTDRPRAYDARPRAHDTDRPRAHEAHPHSHDARPRDARLHEAHPRAHDARPRSHDAARPRAHDTHPRAHDARPRSHDARPRSHDARPRSQGGASFGNGAAGANGHKGAKPRSNHSPGGFSGDRTRSGHHWRARPTAKSS